MRFDLHPGDLIKNLKSASFGNISSISLEKKKSVMQSGVVMVVENSVISCVNHDCLLLHMVPYDTIGQWL